MARIAAVSGGRWQAVALFVITLNTLDTQIQGDCEVQPFGNSRRRLVDKNLVPYLLRRLHHPTAELGTTVMNYELDEPDCSLHPSDILAIHALYQSLN